MKNRIKKHPRVMVQTNKIEFGFSDSKGCDIARIIGPNTLSITIGFIVPKNCILRLNGEDFVRLNK